MACPDPELIATYAEDVLDDAARAEIESHADECGSCRRLLSAIAELPVTTHGSGTPALPRALPPGTMMGRYIVLYTIGRGAMGTVSAAYDPELDRRVALKILHATDHQHRLVTEARSLAKVGHPNVVRVHDVGEDDGCVFVAMEFVDGTTLSDWLAAEPRSWREIVAVFRAAGRGLAASHASGLVHRDFKPHNVLISRTGDVLVTDFGLAKVVGEHAEPRGTGDGPVDASVRAVLGTPAYMAPEQLAAKRADERSDQFSFCVALYEALAGVRPFAGDTLDAIAASITAQRQEPPRRRDAPSGIYKVLAIGLADKPEARHPSMTVLLDRLAAAVARPRRITFATGAVMLAGTLVAAWLALPPRAHSACDGAERQLAGVWDPLVRARLAATFDKAGPHGASTWTAVAMTIDRYTHEWVAMREQACRAANSTMPIAMKCLDDRRDQLERLIRDHEVVSADQIVWTLAAAQALAPVSDCGDPSYLARWAPATSGTMRFGDGLVRAALTISGPGREVIHAAVPIDDGFVVSGIASDGGTFAGKRIDATGYFLARVAGDGTLEWFLTNPSVRVIELARGNSDTVLVAGFYLAASTFAGRSLAAPHGGDCFAAALDAATGQARWLVPCGATQDGEVRTVAADRDGNLYVAGDFAGRATFGGSREINAEARPTMAPFVASWSPSGQLRWVTAGRGTGSSRSKGLAVDGDAVIVGTRITGGGWFGDHELRAGGCVVARLDRATGTIQWLRELALEKCEIDDVAVHDNRVAAVGRARGRGGWIQELRLADGADRWHTVLGTHDQEAITSAFYDNAGPLTVTGYFGGPSLAVGNYTLHGNGAMDVFIASFDEAGAAVGALAFGGAGNDRARWIGQGTAGTTLLAGRYASSIIVGTHELRANGETDGMLLELALPWLEPTRSRP